jgi:hypothetical protein
MLEKKFFIFHASNIVLQQQYKERNFKRYSELISWLLITKKNHEFLMKNHQSHLTSSKSFREVNEPFPKR